MANLTKSFLQYLRTPVARSAEEFGDAIEDEIAFHIEQRTQDYIATGMPADDVKLAALKKFGDASCVAKECHAAAVGDLAVWHRMHLRLHLRAIHRGIRVRHHLVCAARWYKLDLSDPSAGNCVDVET